MSVSGELYAEGHFVIIPEWVLDADVSDKAVRLYGVLRSYADHRTGVAFPSRRTLAGRLRIADVKGVDRALAELEGIGAVEVFRATNAPGQTRSSNRYLLRHTPRGANATPATTGNGQTRSSTPGGVQTPGGADALPPGAQMPHPQGRGRPSPQGRQRPSPRGASAPLTRPIEQENPVLSEQGGRRLAAIDGEAAKELERVVNALAGEHWEATGKVTPFPGVRSIIKAAVTAGHPEPQVRAALTALRRQRRSLTRNALGLLLADPGSARTGSGTNYGPLYQNPDPATADPDIFARGF